MATGIQLDAQWNAATNKYRISAKNPSTEDALMLRALYKRVTDGQHVPRPQRSIVDFYVDREWAKLGALSPEQAKNDYIDIMAKY